MIIHFYLIFEQKFVSCLRYFSFKSIEFLVLLQYHGQLEMHEAIRNAFMHNFHTMMGAHIDTVNPLLVLHVKRDTIVQDTIDQVKFKLQNIEFDIKLKLLFFS